MFIKPAMADVGRLRCTLPMSWKSVGSVESAPGFSVSPLAKICSLRLFITLFVMPCRTLRHFFCNRPREDRAKVASRCSHGIKARRNMASPSLQEPQGAQGQSSLEPALTVSLRCCWEVLPLNITGRVILSVSCSAEQSPSVAKSS